MAKQKKQRGLTLIETVFSVGITSVLISLLVPAAWKLYEATAPVVSTQVLRQLSAAGNLYLAEHDGVYWEYSTVVPSTGIQYWFGFDTQGSAVAEGDRAIDIAGGALGPYMLGYGILPADPAFTLAGKTFKPKYKNLHLAFGYNTLLGTVKKPGKATVPPRRVNTVKSPSQTIVFATSANINTLQAPASPKNPMLEEFYMINDTEYTLHFRHKGRALAIFANGSLGWLPLSEATQDPRLPAANVGRPASKYVDPTL